jgi:transcriptional regulator GlxA family with amidase domain
MCSGALIIAALGHLTGLSATTYPTAFEALKNYGVDVLEDKHLVTHGSVGTAAGCLAAVDLVVNYYQMENDENFIYGKSIILIYVILSTLLLFF